VDLARSITVATERQLHLPLRKRPSETCSAQSWALDPLRSQFTILQPSTAHNVLPHAIARAAAGQAPSCIRIYFSSIHFPKLSSPASEVPLFLCTKRRGSLQGCERGSLSRPPGGPRTRRSPPAEATPPPRTPRTRPPLLARGGRPTLSQSWPPPTGAGPNPGSPGHAWKGRNAQKPILCLFIDQVCVSFMLVRVDRYLFFK
jgi:hypothetical protein